MIFVDWGFVWEFVAFAAVIAGGIWGFRKVQPRSAAIRLPVRIVSSLFAGASLLLLTMVSCGEAVTTHSTPLYSPDGKQAVRTNDYDAGALGGWTTIYLYSDHGFYSQSILGGLWKNAEIKDVRWLSDSEILISVPQWSPDEKLPECASTNHVKVTCVGVPIPHLDN
jgi:hypothetical protein